MNKDIIFNWMLDLRKKDIDKVARARIIKKYMKDNNLSLRNLCKQLGIGKTTLHGWLMYDKLTKKEFNELKSKGISNTAIHRHLQSGIDFEDMVKIDNIDLILTDCIERISKYNNGNLVSTVKTKSLCVELTNLIHRVMIRVR